MTEMDLSKYDDKLVVIVDIDNQIFRGNVTDYFYPDDNDDGKEGIAINDRQRGRLIEFNEDDIKTIEIIK